MSAPADIRINELTANRNFEGRGSEFGEDADFTPYYGNGIIALDACTARSKMVNVIVVED